MHIEELFRKPEFRTVKGSLFGNAEEIKGEWVGETGKRSEFILKVKAVIPIEMGWAVALFRFEDQQGNDVVWFAGKKKDYEEGITYRIRATVKRQTIYQNRRQTQISRPHTLCREYEPYHASEETGSAWDAI